jgi:hypothetical protein
MLSAEALYLKGERPTGAHIANATQAFGFTAGIHTTSRPFYAQRSER